ncbi:PhzF family phenazine biosynthesis protein [Rhodococcus sp. G-MC3]|uniref:PhzF family phenazine biosynthesis protein n=1 Tax=Rhodococcus sp. G-MC3 TaxID=3046209 RepID=UPI0024B9BE41|nr:PhzF family phenazine biosynthesis protein [Rhodococcus sp. G-MC3]MDJ0391757.1 PhzF family phenazine biosynthesis protein [Rhodococcus sp. G-MC3]
MSLEVAVVRVFTDDTGQHGNELGIVWADAVPTRDRQALATDLGFSETIFYSSDGSTRASATIYTPAAPLPFAGHPTVGLSWWLRERGTPLETLSVPAADLAVRYDADLTWIRAKAEWAPVFDIHPVASVDEVDAADPSSFTEGHHYVWAWTDRDAGAIRSRMFAPDMGITEDEATGSAAVRISAELSRSLAIRQGSGSQLFTGYSTEWIEVGGRTVGDRTITL